MPDNSDELEFKDEAKIRERDARKHFIQHDSSCAMNDFNGGYCDCQLYG